MCDIAQESNPKRILGIEYKLRFSERPVDSKASCVIVLQTNTTASEKGIPLTVDLLIRS